MSGAVDNKKTERNVSASPFFELPVTLWVEATSEEGLQFLHSTHLHKRCQWFDVFHVLTIDPERVKRVEGSMTDNVESAYPPVVSEGLPVSVSLERR